MIDNLFIDKTLQDLGWRRREEFAGDFDPRHLGDNPVRGDYGALSIPVDARHAISHERRCQVEVG